MLDLDYSLTEDLNGNCYVDLAGLTLMVQQWLSTEPAASFPYYSPDIVVDKSVNLHDFVMLSERWLVCNDPQDTGCIQNW